MGYSFSSTTLFYDDPSLGSEEHWSWTESNSENFYGKSLLAMNDEKMSADFVKKVQTEQKKTRKK